ncbi:MAG: hypothetical protein ACLR4Z_04690 [Butyricicoccaceae bacterium]
MNYRQGSGEIALVIDDSTPKVFVYDAEFGELSSRALEMCENRPAVELVVGAEGGCRPPRRLQALRGLCFRAAGDRSSDRFRAAYLR